VIDQMVLHGEAARQLLARVSLRNAGRQQPPTST
jgi:hypothetical protein